MDSRRVSSTDIARAAGVSQATVSYVLNRRADKTISAQTQDRVWSAARELGYQRNAAARALVTGKTGMIALWMPNAHHPIFSLVTEVVMRHALADGKRVVISQSPIWNSEASENPPDLIDMQVDGVFAHHGATPVENYLELTKGRSPIVSTGASYTTKCDCVGIDLHEGSLVALRHLVGIGCRRIAYVVLDWAMHLGDPRYRAYLDVCEEVGMEPQFIALDQLKRSIARERIADRLKSGTEIDGLFCWNDEVATAANMAARDTGKRVPTDIAIIGSDGTEEAEFQYPSISTVAHPIEEMVSIAWAFLMRRIENPNVDAQQVVLPMSLIKRQSTER